MKTRKTILLSACCHQQIRKSLSTSLRRTSMQCPMHQIREQSPDNQDTRESSIPSSGYSNLQCEHSIELPVPATTQNYHLNHGRPESEIPGPKSYPLIGTLYKYIPKFGEYNIRDAIKTDQRRFHKHGPLVREKLFPGFTMYHVFDLELIRQVYDQERTFPDRFPLPGLQAYRKSRDAPLGLALSSGEEWKTQRRAASDLMKPEYIKNFYDAQQRISEDFVKLISDLRDDNNEIADTLPLFYRYALESVGNVLVGKRLGTLTPKLKEGSDALRLIDAVLLAMDSLCHTTFFWPLHSNKKTKVWKNLCESCDFIQGVGLRHANECIDQLETNSSGGTISYLKTLLSKPELKMNDALALIADMMFAGIETTGIVTTLNIYNLARHPEKQERLYQEILEHAPLEGPISQEAIGRMKYLKAVIKETFRTTPLGNGNARILTKDMVLKGYNVPKGSLMMLNTLMACQSTDYVKEPEKYLPERWLGETNETLHPYLVLPFGHGSRSCLGRRLATQEIQMAILRLVQNFKIEYHNEDIGFVTRFGNTPDRPLQFRFIERV